jgi:hypothetical protein
MLCCKIKNAILMHFTTKCFQSFCSPRKEMAYLPAEKAWQLNNDETESNKLAKCDFLV